MTGNEKYDRVERRMVMKGAQWLCHGADPRSPLISPIRADLGGLSPIYVRVCDEPDQRPVRGGVLGHGPSPHRLMPAGHCFGRVPMGVV
jgi:hypothetical protein